MAEGVVERPTKVGRVLGNRRGRNCYGGSVHGLKYIFFRAFVFSFDFSGRVFDVFRKRLEVSVQSSAVGVGVSPFSFVIANAISSLMKISLCYGIKYCSFDLVIVHDDLVRVK